MRERWPHWDALRCKCRSVRGTAAQRQLNAAQALVTSGWSLTQLSKQPAVEHLAAPPLLTSAGLDSVQAPCWLEWWLCVPSWCPAAQLSGQQLSGSSHWGRATFFSAPTQRECASPPVLLVQGNHRTSRLIEHGKNSAGSWASATRSRCQAAAPVRPRGCGAEGKSPTGRPAP